VLDDGKEKLRAYTTRSMKKEEPGKDWVFIFVNVIVHHNAAQIGKGEGTAAASA
jgi:hypothetical protein